MTPITMMLQKDYTEVIRKAEEAILFREAYSYIREELELNHCPKCKKKIALYFIKDMESRPVTVICRDCTAELLDISLDGKFTLCKDISRPLKLYYTCPNHSDVHIPVKTEGFAFVKEVIFCRYCMSQLELKQEVECTQKT